jgi:uncharacterized alpha/beta hydrolase family protein
MAKKKSKQASKKEILTISGHKRDANQDHTKVPPQKHHHQQMLARMQGKRNLHTLLVGMQTSKTTLENNMEAS